MAAPLADSFTHRLFCRVAWFLVGALFALAANDALAAPPPLRLAPVAIGFNAPVSLAHHAASGRILVAANHPDGRPYNFEVVGGDGARAQFSRVSGLGDEVFVTVERAGGAFPPGETFFGAAGRGAIARVAADGSKIANPWVVLPDEPGEIHAGLHLDRSGRYGGELLVVTTAGNLWRVDAAGRTAFIARVGVYLDGVRTLPDEPDRYGPWAGRILATSSVSGRILAVDPVAVGAPDVRSDRIDGIDAPASLERIPAGENLYGVDSRSRVVWCADAAQLAVLAGEILVGEELSGRLWQVRWDVAAGRFVPRLLARVPHWQGATFSPVALPTSDVPVGDLPPSPLRASSPAELAAHTSR